MIENIIGKVVPINPKAYEDGKKEYEDEYNIMAKNVWLDKIKANKKAQEKLDLIKGKIVPTNPNELWLANYKKDDIDKIQEKIKATKDQLKKIEEFKKNMPESEKKEFREKIERRYQENWAKFKKI